MKEVVLTQRRLGGLMALLVAASALAACTGGATDRSGAETLQLRMATIDGNEFGQEGGRLVGPETFVRELEALSGGRMHVEVSTSYGMGAADAESRLVEAIATGDLDGGWPATRAFSIAGIHGLEAVEAPLKLVNDEAVAELVDGKAAAIALSSLEDSGVVGLGLAAGGLRRPFATRALTEVADWQGARFRVFNSPVQADAVSALGGEPVVFGPGWIEEVAVGRLDGAEFALDSYVDWYGASADNVALNVVLWPKVFVLSLSQDRFDDLDSQQQSWVFEAAARATDASLEVESDGVSVEDLCDVGLKFHLATPSQLDGLRATVEPVVESLRAADSTVQLMEAVDDIADRYPDPDSRTVPTDCAPAHPPEASDVPVEVSALPDGVYRTEIPVQAVIDGGVDNNSGFSGIWTLVVKDGVYELSCRPLDKPGRDCGNVVTDAVLEAGRLMGKSNVAYFVADAELMAAKTGCSIAPDLGDGEPCMVLDTYSARWRVEDDELTFTASEGPAGSYLVLRPWVRIAATG